MENNTVLYECGICNCFHPWDWDADCRDDENRFPDPEEYAKKIGVSVYDVEVRSWEERCAADGWEDDELGSPEKSEA